MQTDTICVECAHCEIRLDLITSGHFCRVSTCKVGNFVTGFSWENLRCSDVNTDGKCPAFESCQHKPLTFNT